METVIESLILLGKCCLEEGKLEKALLGREGRLDEMFKIVLENIAIKTYTL